MVMTMMQHKKILKEKMKNMSREEQIEMCFKLQRDTSAEMNLRKAANSIFCSLVDVHAWLCGMANTRISEPAKIGEQE